MDYLLNCVDNCYQVLKKEEPSRRNPIRLIQGKQRKTRSCACGQTRESVEEGAKEVRESVFQYSYINLTSLLCPVTDISFEVCESYVRVESPRDA